MRQLQNHNSAGLPKLQQQSCLKSGNQFSSNQNEVRDIHGMLLRRQNSTMSERKREVKHHRKASYFTKVQKKQEGLLSEDDNISSFNVYGDEQAIISFDPLLDPQPNEYMHSSIMTEERLILDDDYMLDITQDLPIRKPQSAYVIFGKMKRDLIMRQNPGIKVTEVVKQIAKLWQALSKEEKLRYKDRAKQDKERYIQELRELTKSNKNLEKPKKPLTPYMLFVRETRPKVVRENPNIASLDIMKEVGRIWQNITKDELQYFKIKSDSDMERYKKEHQKFIQDINDLRALSTKEKNDLKLQTGDNRLLSDRVPQIKPQQCDENQLSGIKQFNVQEKRRKIDQVNNMQTPEPLIKGTPLKQDKNYAHYAQDTPSTNNDEPVSPYMRAKREVSRPKKPLSAYIYFSQEFREKLKEQHPEWSSNEIMRHVSNKWQHMDRQQKDPYNQMAALDKSRYDKQLLEFTQMAEAPGEHIFDFRKPRRSFDNSESQSHSHHNLNISDMKCQEYKPRNSATKDTNPSQHGEYLNAYQHDEKFPIPQRSPMRGQDDSNIPFTPFNNAATVGSSNYYNMEPPSSIQNQAYQTQNAGSGMNQGALNYQQPGYMNQSPMVRPLYPDFNMSQSNTKFLCEDGQMDFQNTNYDSFNQQLLLPSFYNFDEQSFFKNLDSFTQRASSNQVQSENYLNEKKDIFDSYGMRDQQGFN